EESPESIRDFGLRMTCAEIFRFVSEFAGSGASDRAPVRRLLGAGTLAKMLRTRASLPAYSRLYDSWSTGWARFGTETFGHNAVTPEGGARIVARFSSRADKVIVMIARTCRVFPLLVDLCRTILPLETP